MSYYTRQTITQVHHWDDKLFSFKCTRDPDLQFENGQFVLIGLMQNEKPLLRAYSFVNANHEPELEFLSIKVPEGALTSRLQHIQPGDELIVAKAAKGTLVVSDLSPGKRLLLLSTGTGLAPFISILRDDQLRAKFEQIILVHGVRRVSELAYAEELQRFAMHPGCHYYPTVTREPFKHQGRIPTLMASGQLFRDLGLAPLDPVTDRVMICGNGAMLNETRALLETQGFKGS
ncbi:MAG: ferredoxin--NADP reductase, partial [Rhodocyclaceae bacterium]|nr:ferredoxin--NADP reductase [Rhodocyclaceae bacterium]